VKALKSKFFGGKTNSLALDTEIVRQLFRPDRVLELKVKPKANPREL